MRNQIVVVLFSMFLLICGPQAVLAKNDGNPPPTATIQVDCNDGDTIMEALEEPGVELTIEIDGICVENVVVQRPNVTLIGDDNTADGIDGSPGISVLPGFGTSTLLLLYARTTQIENLKLTGGDLGLHLQFSGSNVINVRIEGNTEGMFARESVTALLDSIVTGNDFRGVNLVGGSFFLNNSSITGNPGVAGDGGIGLFGREVCLCQAERRNDWWR